MKITPFEFRCQYDDVTIVIQYYGEQMIGVESEIEVFFDMYLFLAISFLCGTRYFGK